MEKSASKPFLSVLDGEKQARPPIWMMRQAGRYLPEYREIRSKAPSFLEFCYSPDLAVEATLQPIRRYGFDAAILFSDILVIPDALGQKVTFEQGEGPRLQPIGDLKGLQALSETLDLRRLEAVFETIRRLRSALPSGVALIGFCGAPWTVASYMIAGRSTPDQGPARLFAYRHPDLFQMLIQKLVDASVDYLVAQFKAGVEAVQVFDSWAGVLPGLEFEKWCYAPLVEIVARVKAAVPDGRIILFPRGAGTRLVQFTDVAGVNALGIDTAVDPLWAAQHIQPFKPVQGNLDPLALVAGGTALDRSIDHILNSLSTGPHIFNLGHGIVPETPLAHVEHLVKRLREG